MRKRKLGRTGYEVAKLGIGTLGMAGDMWRGIAPGDAQRTLYEAIERGVELVDTARSYGDGMTEKLVGEVIRDLRARDRVVLATKVPPMNGAFPATAEVPLERVFHPDHVQRSVEESLRNTRVEALPIAQFHVWHDAFLRSSAWPEVRGRMGRLIKEGKVLHWGVSINSCEPESALAILEDPLIETAQVVYNIYERGCETNFFAKARAHDVGVIARSPLDEGALSGRLTRETRFPRGDFRARYFAGEQLAQAVERAHALASLCGEEAATLPELALRFVWQNEDVAVVIPGMRRSEHVQANILAASAAPLSDEMMARLEEHAWAKNWYSSANREEPS